MQPLIISHRGNNRVAPENTLPAFRSSVALGVDYIELDYHHSADGVQVVHHDPTLDKHTDAMAHWGQERLKVAERTWAELQQLDAGSWFAPKFAGTRLCTLAEALRVICAGTRCMIERKAGDAAACLNTIRQEQVADRVVVMAFDWKFIADCRQLDAGLPLGALGKDELTADRCREALAAGANYVGWRQQDLTAAGIAAAHDLGLMVWSYTINEVARANELVAAGLDGVITDTPSSMLEVWPRG